MNDWFQRAVFPMWAVGTMVVVAAVFHLAAMGEPSMAQEEPKSEKPSRAAQRGLRDEPLAAGRNRAALAAEDAEARRKRDLKRVMELSEAGCGLCHACENPTDESPCLRMCPRILAEAIAEAAHEKLPEDIVLLDAFPWSDRRFMPVPFTHETHAHMAGMAGGCQVCHHHTAEGRAHPACKTCHKPVFAAGSAKEELRMPSLKGAYHRQCVGCHREWSGETTCSVCHAVKGNQARPTDVKEMLAEGHFVKYPIVESPEDVLHKTGYDLGPYVMFRHKDHIDRYGYACDRCHSDQPCSRCHGRTEKPKQPREIERQRHTACFPCHEDDACERCHSKEESPGPKYLDHAVTGFPLGRHHERLTCRACHRRLWFIRKLEGGCTFCHKDWEPETFNHAVTGQALDENHADIDCADCHAEHKFDRPPVCTECHEEDEGFIFPKKRPGPVVDLKKPADPKHSVSSSKKTVGARSKGESKADSRS